MTIPRCYVPQALTPGEVIELPDTVVHHLGHVLRLRSGSELTLFNGQGGEYTAQLVRIGKKQAQAEVGEHRDIERESPLSLTLAQGISRGQKMDYTLQKAVELGCQKLVPVLNERSSIRLPDERRQKKHEHWQNIIIAACEQCGRNRIPELAMPVPLEEWVRSDRHAIRLVLDPAAGNSLSDLDLATGELSLLIGSEAGLDAGEITLAEDSGYQRVSLGRRILRTETAAVTALGICQALWGDI